MTDEITVDSVIEHATVEDAEQAFFDLMQEEAGIQTMFDECAEIVQLIDALESDRETHCHTASFEALDLPELAYYTGSAEPCSSFEAIDASLEKLRLSFSEKMTILIEKVRQFFDKISIAYRVSHHIFGVRTRKYEKMKKPVWDKVGKVITFPTRYVDDDEKSFLDKADHCLEALTAAKFDFDRTILDFSTGSEIRIMRHKYGRSVPYVCKGNVKKEIGDLIKRGDKSSGVLKRVQHSRKVVDRVKPGKIDVANRHVTPMQVLRVAKLAYGLVWTTKIKEIRAIGKVIANTKES